MNNHVDIEPTSSTSNQLPPLEHHQVRAVQQVVRQINQRLSRVSKMVTAKLAGKSTTP